MAEYKTLVANDKVTPVLFDDEVNAPRAELLLALAEARADSALYAQAWDDAVTDLTQARHDLLSARADLELSKREVEELSRLVPMDSEPDPEEGQTLDFDPGDWEVVGYTSSGGAVYIAPEGTTPVFPSYYREGDTFRVVEDPFWKVGDETLFHRDHTDGYYHKRPKVGDVVTVERDGLDRHGNVSASGWMIHPEALAKVVL